MIRRKDEVIQKFSSLQLEELLNNSTKNVAQEVVTCLIPKRGEGVLVTLEMQQPNRMNKQSTANGPRTDNRHNTDHDPQQQTHLPSLI